MSLAFIRSISQLSPVSLVLMTVALGYIIWHLIKYFLNHNQFNEKFNKLPHFPSGGSFLSIILGHLDVVFSYFFYIPKEKVAIHLLNSLGSIEDIREKKVVVFNLGLQRNVFLFHHKTVEVLMSSNSNIRKSKIYDFLDSWLGEGLLTSYGDKWKRNRKFLTPAFHFKVLESFVPIMNEDVEIMVQKIEKLIEKDVNAMNQNGIDIRALITNCTLDTICETAMGVKVGAQKDVENNEYVKAILIVLDLMTDRVLSPLKHPNLIYYLTKDGQTYNKHLKFIHSFVQKVIDDRFESLKNQIKNNEIDLKDLNNNNNIGFQTRKRFVFLDSLLITHLNDPEIFTMKNISDEVNTFMFEGHDTTSTSLMYTTFLIANDQRVQEKLHEEMDSIFGSDYQREITFEDCRQMKYLEMCIKEGLRLYPSVPLISRRVTEDFKAEEYTIPTGSEAMVPIIVLHRDPTVFSRPHVFIPERFEPEQPIHKMPYAYMPFAAGPRNCIGQKFAMTEMKILLAAIFRRFHLNSISLIDENDAIVNAIIKSYSPINVSFKLRNHSPK